MACWLWRAGRGALAVEGWPWQRKPSAVLRSEEGARHLSGRKARAGDIREPTGEERGSLSPPRLLPGNRTRGPLSRGGKSCAQVTETAGGRGGT